MNETDVESQVQAKGLTAPRITPAQIDALMERVTYLANHPANTTSTFVHAYLDGRFLLATGHSACVSPENYDAEIGIGIAKGNAEKAAREKLWELEGYRLFAQLNYPHDLPRKLELVKGPVPPPPTAPLMFVDTLPVLKLGDQVEFFERPEGQDQISSAMLAFVTKATSPHIVSLAIFATNGTHHARQDVALLGPYEEAPLHLTIFARRKENAA